MYKGPAGFQQSQLEPDSCDGLRFERRFNQQRLNGVPS